MNRILATVLLVQIVLLSYETLFYHFLSTISGLTRFQISHCVPKFSWVFAFLRQDVFTLSVYTTTYSRPTNLPATNGVSLSIFCIAFRLLN